MTNRYSPSKLRFLSALAILLPIIFTSSQVLGTALAGPAATSAFALGQSAPATFADPLFQQIWARTDAPVQLGEAQRSWYWGPDPGKTLQEPFTGSQTGTRLVQYFDKARMEVNDPNGDRTSPWFVTTGLLVSDMVAGKEQVGDAQYKVIGPAEIAVGGDGLGTDPDAPTYTSFRPYASLKGPDDNRAPNRTGQPVTATINRAGTVGDNPAMGYYPGTIIAAYSSELGHNIPQAMWDFLNLKGVVQENGVLNDQTIANWVFVMGYPITEPYWARIQINGVFYDALFQMYQRRSLAYVPSLPQGWQVQMGNVGAHYYRWLYGGPLPAPLVPFTPTPPPPTSTPVLPDTPVVPEPTSTGLVGTPTLPAASPTDTPWPTDEPPPTDGTITPTPTFPPVPTEPPGGFIVSVHPPYGPPDGQFTFQATGLSPNEGVQVQFTNPNGDVVYPAGSNNGHYVVGPDGTLSITLVPAQAFPSAPLGVWLFQVQGLQSGLVGTVGFTLQ